VRRRFDVPVDEYLRRCDASVEQFERMRVTSRCGDPVDVHRSNEYGSTIIHSMVTGRPSVVYGNMPNRGAITNLPDNAIAEAPTLVDRSGPRFTTVGELPPQLVAYMTPHVAQHELFIRAATEGRRDHVYQACMFDPLTAATMPPERIVEMCDELIAAHGFERDGGVLPDLDATRTLVPTSGKRFPKLEPKSLRASWDAEQQRRQGRFITDWHVMGPFRGGPQGRVNLDLPTAFEDAHRAGNREAPNLTSTCALNGKVLTWKSARAAGNGFVDLDRALGKSEWSVAYAYASLDSKAPRDLLLRCGSDDGIRIWLNGEQVHSREVGRAYRPGDDELAVTLRAGANHILIKIVNYQGGWGFGVSLCE
jgi:hypothetical protein